LGLPTGQIVVATLSNSIVVCDHIGTRTPLSITEDAGSGLESVRGLAFLAAS